MYSLNRFSLINHVFSEPKPQLFLRSMSTLKRIPKKKHFPRNHLYKTRHKNGMEKTTAATTISSSTATRATQVLSIQNSTFKSTHNDVESGMLYASVLRHKKKKFNFSSSSSSASFYSSRPALSAMQKIKLDQDSACLNDLKEKLSKAIKIEDQELAYMNIKRNPQAMVDVKKKNSSSKTFTRLDIKKFKHILSPELERNTSLSQSSRLEWKPPIQISYKKGIQQTLTRERGVTRERRVVTQKFSYRKKYKPQKFNSLLKRRRANTSSLASSPSPYSSSSLSPSPTNPQLREPHESEHPYILPMLNLSQFSKLSSKPLVIEPLVEFENHDRVPELAHGLSQILSHPGHVFPLRKLGEKGYNFTKFLKKLHQPDQVNWQCIPTFKPPSHDEVLFDVVRNARKNHLRYVSSTSASTGALSNIYHIVSNFGEANLKNLQDTFAKSKAQFGRYAYKPVTLSLKRKDQVYSVDYVQYTENREPILMHMGHSMERMLTMNQDDFMARLIMNPKHQLSEELAKKYADEDVQSYNYTMFGSMLLRAQLDCKNAKTGEFFDLKTRATAPIRYDLENYKKYLNYKISRVSGLVHSYEREFYDMIKVAFMKYAFQLKLGRMSGVFVTFHNTLEIFGFEYVTLEEIENFTFGSEHWACISFEAIFKLYLEILDTVVERFGSADNIKITIDPNFRTRALNVYAYKVDEEVDPLCPKLVFEAFQKKQGNNLKSGDEGWKSLGIDKSRICKLQVKAIPCKGGVPIRGMVKMKKDDEFECYYNVSETPLEDASSFLFLLQRAYGIRPMTKVKIQRKTNLD